MDKTLTTNEQSLLLAAFFRGVTRDREIWTSCCDQVVTLSLFYTGDISSSECERRFAVNSYIASLYDDDGELTEEIRLRYQNLINLIREHSDLIEGAGNLRQPADPTFTSCRLTSAGDEAALSLVESFPAKPQFPNWPDKRTLPLSKR